MRSIDALHVARLLLRGLPGPTMGADIHSDASLTEMCVFLTCVLQSSAAARPKLTPSIDFM
jgi:hypothetical protein